MAKDTQEFAVIETGGKQYVVRVGDVLDVEKLDGDYQAGDKVIFDRVLLIDDGKNTNIGTPYLTDAKVQAMFEETAKGDKLTVRRFRSKSRYHRTYGHRQPYTRVKITSLK